MVADLVRGKKVGEALAALSLCPKKPARVVAKVLRSAVANAVQLYKVDVDDLVVREITVNGGPMLKRWRPRAMGRATRIRRRTSHVKVTVGDM